LREVGVRVPDGDPSAILLEGTKLSTVIGDPSMALAVINLETVDVVVMVAGVIPGRLETILAIENQPCSTGKSNF